MNTVNASKGVNLAIVGLGRWGKTLVQSVQGTSEIVHFTAAVTRSPESVSTFTQHQGLRCYQNLTDALASGKFDGVVIATPHSEHEAQAIEVIEAGFPIFVEKPFTMSRSGALRVAEAARERGLVVAVGFNRRFAPAVRELKRMIDDGELGTIQHVEGHFSGSFAYRYSADMWRAKEEESPVGGLMPMGVHILDAMVGMVGPIAAVQALSTRRVLEIDQDDTTVVNVKFTAGMLGVLTIITTTAPLFRIQVFGSRGWASADGGNVVANSTIDGTLTRTTYPTVDLERAELEAFSRAITDNEAYPVSIHEAISGVAATDAIVQSANESKWIDVQQ